MLWMFFLTLLFPNHRNYDEFNKYTSKSRTNTTLTSTQKSDTKYNLHSNLNKQNCTAIRLNFRVNAALDTKISKVSCQQYMNIFVKFYILKQTLVYLRAQKRKKKFQVVSI